MHTPHAHESQRKSLHHVLWRLRGLRQRPHGLPGEWPRLRAVRLFSRCSSSAAASRFSQGRARRRRPPPKSPSRSPRRRPRRRPRPRRRRRPSRRASLRRRARQRRRARRRRKTRRRSPRRLALRMRSVECSPPGSLVRRRLSQSELLCSRPFWTLPSGARKAPLLRRARRRARRRASRRASQARRERS